jgi:hypothetical protein
MIRLTGIMAAYSTEVQSNHPVESAADDFCGFIGKFMRGVPKDVHNVMNHGCEQDE